MALTKVDISLMDNATGFTIVTKVVTVAASKLVIDGVSQDTLTLTEGYTYKFDTSHATLSGHTVSFATAADAAGSTQYTTGVTTNGTPGNAGAYTQIVVAQSAPVLYYYCANHASMGGTTSTPAAVIANKLLAYDGSGNLPAVDGSQLTNVSTATSSASDPTVSTNPSGGVGTEWQNTTSGEVYICTDATAGANVWTNVGAGSGDIQSVFQGSQYGFSAGGDMPAVGLTNVIEKYSYSSDGNATDHGDLIDVGNGGRNIGTGHRSRTHGYITGGYSYPSPGELNNIEKYQFSTSSNSTDVGNLLQANWYMSASSSLTHGYCSGGSAPSPESNVIEKFSFSSDGNSSDVGNLTVARKYNMGGCTSIENGYGYHAGGHNVAAKNTIDKYAYASDGDATDAGDLYQHNYGGGTCSSTSYGWVLGGVNTTPATVNMIQKFAFVNNVTGTDVADLSVPHGSYPAGSSATTHGYKIGGTGSPYAGTGNVIDKFAYESTSNATDVGDSTYYAGFRSSCQY